MQTRFPQLISMIDLIITGTHESPPLDSAQIESKVINILTQHQSLWLIEECAVHEVYDLILNLAPGVSSIVSLYTGDDYSNCSICYSGATGIIHLNVNKQTYQRLGLTGKLSDRHSGRYLVAIECLKQNSSLREKLMRLENDRFRLLARIDSSSAESPPTMGRLRAKPVAVEQMIAETKFYGSLAVPIINTTAKDRRETLESIYEWMGLVQCDAKLALTGQTSRMDPYISNYNLPVPNHPGWVCRIRICGLFHLNHVEQLIQEILLARNQLGYIFCKSFRDIPQFKSKDFIRHGYQRLIINGQLI